MNLSTSSRIVTIVFLLLLAACQGRSALSTMTGKTPTITETTQVLLQPGSTTATQRITPSIEPTRTSTPALPDDTTSATPTNTPVPAPAPMSVVKEENGWITYRNEVVGYEISVPNSYQIKGEYPYPGSGSTGHGLLGPAVPDEEIARLLERYYGESLYIWMGEPNPSGKVEHWLIGIYAYDIIVKDLGGDVSPGGMGDYLLTSRQETLYIDWQSYPVRFTVMLRDHQPVGELAVLYLEKDGIELMFGYTQAEDNPQAYQTYLEEKWPEVRRIIETYRKLPEKTTVSGEPWVNAAGLADPSPPAVAQALFEQYLMAYQESPMDPLMKLSSYQIDEVAIPEKWQPCADSNQAEFIAAIIYSVKPEHWPPDRWAEDGYATFDNWIRRKSASMAVFRSDQDYTMKILGKPVCPGF